MDAPPVNRLLQLLRQKPSETSEPSHASQSHASLDVSAPQSIPQSNMLTATESDTQPARQSDRQSVPKSSRQSAQSNIQPATESDTQPARQSDRQSVPKSSRQSAQSNIQPATESDITPIQGSSIQPATYEKISLAVTGLSKGQQRVLRFLLSNQDASNALVPSPLVMTQSQGIVF